MGLFENAGLVDKSVASRDTTSAQILAKNTGRNYLMIQNVSATVDAWVNLTGGTAAPNTAGSIRLAANGGYVEFVGPFVPSNAITARSASSTVPLTILEGN